MNPSNVPQNPAPAGGGFQPSQAGGNLNVPHAQPGPQIPYTPQPPVAPAGRYIDGISPVKPQPSTLDISSIDPARLPGIHTPTAPHTAPIQPIQHMPQAPPGAYQQHGTDQFSHSSVQPAYHPPVQPPAGFGQQQQQGNISDIMPHGVRPMRPAAPQQAPQDQQNPALSDQERLMAIENALPQPQYPAPAPQQPAPAPPMYPPLDQVVNSPAQPAQVAAPVQPQPVPQPHYQPQPQPQYQPQPPVQQPAEVYPQQQVAASPEPEPAPATVPVYEPGAQQTEYSRPTDFLEATPAEEPNQSLQNALKNEQQPAQPGIIASDSERSSFSFPGFSKIGKSVASVFGLILLVWGGAAVLNAFVFQSYYVDGMSMMPTLHDNDRLIISRVEKTSSEIGRHSYVPERGHIVVIDSAVSPLTASRDEQLIKRVVGLPGETITIEGGHVYIKNQSHPNGFDVDKELKITVPATYIDSPLTLTIPDDHVFVMGDNRGPNGSYDSRAFGPIPTTMVQGRLWIRVLPFDKLNVF